MRLISVLQDGTQEVAVKVVRKEFFKQDPKVRENLDREIRILTLLRGCEYVVHLHHKQVGWTDKLSLYSVNLIGYSCFRRS